jgi:hypothetical protein
MVHVVDHRQADLEAGRPGDGPRSAAFEFSVSLLAAMIMIRVDLSKDGMESLRADDRGGL